MAQHRIKATLGIAAALCALGLAACGGGSSSSSGSGSASSTAAASAGPSASATLNYALPYDPSSLDLTRFYDVNSPTIISATQDTLERMSMSGALSPDLAGSVSQPNPTTIVYTLRPGIRFSDGSPLTAADVVWSVDHTFGPAALKAGAQTATSALSVAGATASANRVIVHLKYPDPTARAYIALLVFVGEKKFAQAHAQALGSPGAVAIGTGPYMVSSDSAQGITLTRNPYFWGPKPYAAKINFSFIADDHTAQAAMQSGSIQAANVQNLSAMAPWQEISGAGIYPGPSFTTNYLSMDVTQAPFSDIHVRKAIAYATDAAGLAHAAYGTNAQLQQGLLPAAAIAGVAGSTSAAQSFLSSLPQYSYNLAQAKAQLAQSSVPHGFSTTIPYTQSAGPWAQLAALSLQQTLGQIGIKATPKVLTSDQLNAILQAHKNLGLQLQFLVSTPPDPNGGLIPVVGAAQTHPGGLNFANWTTPAVEKAIPQVAGSLDPATRWAGTQTILRQVAEQVPYVPLFTPNDVYVLAGGFKYARAMSVVDFLNGDWVFLVHAG